MTRLKQVMKVRLQLDMTVVLRRKGTSTLVLALNLTSSSIERSCEDTVKSFVLRAEERNLIRIQPWVSTLHGFEEMKFYLTYPVCGILLWYMQ